MNARRLTVAHQSPGECAYCDEQHARIVAAVARELAQQIRTASYYDHVPEWGFSHQRDAWNDGRDVAASLIDPEVTP